VARQVEGDQAVIFGEPSLQLMLENTSAGRIAMDHQHRHSAATALLDREGAVRCNDTVLPGRSAHADILRADEGVLYFSVSDLALLQWLQT
jgi:hypothetical protein